MIVPTHSYPSSWSPGLPPRLGDCWRRRYHPHYRNSDLYRVPGALPSAFCRALGKEAFAESRTRQSPALGNELVCRVQHTRYRNTLSKEFFTECRTLSGRLKLTAVNLCRGSRVGTRQRGFFAECQPADTWQRPLYRVSVLGTR
jgi:hypothetical protein